MEHISKLYIPRRGLFHREEERCPLGNNDIDKFLDGFPTDTGIITIAGESGMGKSRLLKTLMYYLSFCQKIPCAYISCRKNYRREADVFLAGTLGLSFSEMKEDTEVCKNIEKIKYADSIISESTLYYLSTYSQSIELLLLREKLYTAVRERDIKFVFIDGFQEINFSQQTWGDNRYREQLKAAELHKLSSELNIPIIVTSSLNWTHYNRECCVRPILQDLAGIGDLQETSNMVFTVFRPETCGLLQDASGHDLRGTTEIAIIKNDFGACKSGTFFTDGPIFDYKYLFETNVL